SRFSGEEAARHLGAAPYPEPARRGPGRRQETCGGRTASPGRLQGPEGPRVGPPRPEPEAIADRRSGAARPVLRSLGTAAQSRRMAAQTRKGEGSTEPAGAVTSALDKPSSFPNSRPDIPSGIERCVKQRSG